MKKKAHPLIGKIVRRMGAALSALLLIAVFYVAVVLGQPMQDDNAVEVSQTQPLLAGSPAINIASEAEIDSVLVNFPVPVMYAVPNSGLTLQQGSSYDAAYENGFGRIVSLTYGAEVNGQSVTMTVQTIYPARAIELMGKGDYRIASVGGQALAGLQSIRMENDDTIRLHAQASDALYVLTLPKLASGDMAGLIRSLQLYVKEGV